RPIVLVLVVVLVLDTFFCSRCPSVGVRRPGGTAPGRARTASWRSAADVDRHKTVAFEDSSEKTLAFGARER
ncbi:unnamed protein product, partial [marine sediment metagenome]